MKLKKIKKISALLIAFSFLITAGCRKNPVTSSSGSDLSPAGTPSGAQNSYITLLYSSADTFNPYTAKTDINRRLCRLLYDSLIKTDNEFNPVFSLAEKGELNKKSYTVTLKDAKFSDGTAVTADDVVYSFKLAKASSSEYAHKLYEAASVKAANAKTVVFALTKGDPYFANLLDFPIIKAGSEKKTNSDSVTLPPVGSGRYKLNETQDGMTVNPHYALSGGFSVKEIKLINAPDKDSVSHYVEVGAADVYYSDISDGKIVRMSGKKLSINLNNIVYIGINGKYGDLKQTLLRQAISAAIDRTVICRDGYYNNAVAATGFYNPVWKTVNSVQNIQINANKEISVENLKEIGYNNLDKNGVRKNKSGAALNFELLVNSENRTRVSAAQLIAEQLAACGFKITVVQKPFAEYQKRLSEGNFQLYLAESSITPNMDLTELITEGGKAAYGLSVSDTSSDSSAVSSSTSAASSSVSSGASSQASSEGEASVSVKALLEGFYNGSNSITDIASVLQNEMPFIPICYRTGVLFYNDSIKNIGTPSLSDIYFSVDAYKVSAPK